MIELSYVSLFSGIEAFSVAASRVEGVRIGLIPEEEPCQAP